MKQTRLFQTLVFALPVILWPCLCRATTFTNDAAIKYGDLTYDGQDIAVSNCSLTIDGEHTFASLMVLNGGVVSHSYYPNGVLPTTRQVTGEVHVLSFTNLDITAYSVAETSSVVVRDISGTVTYTNGIDYLVTFTNSLGWLLLPPGSAIAEGSSNLVDYLAPSSASVGTAISVSGDVLIAVGGRINVDARGYGSANGPGRGLTAGSPPSGSGGTYAGTGGASIGSYSTPPSPYGLIAKPADKGSGGGDGSSVQSGGPGGGQVSLEVGGVLRVDGQISANGGSSAGRRSGGGSGGSVYLKAQVFAGTGRVMANGGNGDPGQGGGGGGGRIAVEYSTSVFAGKCEAFGGDGYQPGGAGSVYLKQMRSLAGVLLFDNGGKGNGTTTLSTGGAYDLSIQNGAILSLSNASVNSLSVGSNALVNFGPAMFTIVSNAVIDPGGVISADGAGYTAGQGPGAGKGSSYQTYYNLSAAGGGGYGGCGGSALVPGAYGGTTYASFVNPTEKGSGGGYYSVIPKDRSGAGGGVIRMTIGGVLVCNGRISANGNAGSANAGGGGAGGSVWLTVGTLAGGGVISANGGAGDGLGLYGSGGGGGGRIMVEYGANFFFGSIAAYGGPGYTYGGAGTIYTKPKTQSVGLLTIDNGGNSGANTLFQSGPPVNLNVLRGAKASSFGTYCDVLVGSNSWILPFDRGDSHRDYTSYSLTVSNLTVEKGGGIVLDGMGSLGNSGTGRGSSSSGGSGGGGYGGFGGGVPRGAGGACYGYVIPYEYPGSGGGGYPSSYAGGSGGGALLLTVKEVMHLDGTVSANGGSATNSLSGGGSGGAITISAGTIVGSGKILANGGKGGADSGGGGGGRIVIHYTENAFSGTVSAFGGDGLARGGAGTINTRRGTSGYGSVLVDNGGYIGTNTSCNAFPTVDLIVRNGAVATIPPGAKLSSLVIGSGGLFRLSNDSITVTGDVVVEAGGGIVANGTGYGPGMGTGAGRAVYGTYGSAGGGGGCGGYGGDPLKTNSLPLGGMAYGYLNQAPTVGMGSGGGGYNAIGGSGGGAIALSINGTLVLRGTISADGTAGIASGGGGGSGGTVYISAGTILGDGTITADGGQGNGLAGGGGGGRISLNYSTNLFSGRISAYGGGPDRALGGAGLITMTRKGSVPYYLVDNGGRRGTNTLLYSQSTIDLEIRNGGVAWPYLPALPLNNLTVGQGGVYTFQSQQSRADLYVGGNATIRPGGRITVDALGYAPGSGPGAGRTANNMGSGAGYGGNGGASASSPGGAAYGVAEQPTDFGSGGGIGYGPALSTSRGGGALRMRVTGTCTVDGEISANAPNATQDSAGGGSGGSVWIDAGILVGEGSITANGGDGEPYSGGGGAGGRIAIYTPMNLFGGSVSAAGGDGYEHGQAGSIFYAAAPLPINVVSQSPVGTFARAVSYVDLTFDTPVLSGSLSTSDVVFVTPAGVMPSSNISVSVAAPKVVHISFPPQSDEGLYTLEFGPQVQNLHLQNMSQTYAGTFTIVWATVLGKVTNHLGQPIVGVQVSTSPASSTVLTDANGNYSIKVPPADSVSVVPSKPGFAFDPPSRTYRDLGTSLAGQDFLGLPLPAVTVTASGGSLLLKWEGVEGITYQPFYSTNLVNWEPWNGPLVCTNSGELMGVDMAIAGKPQVFFKLQTSCSSQ